MYEVSIRAVFSAAHNLRGYRGKCEKVHGHNWAVEATIASRELGKSGMVMDFVALKKKLKNILAGLDHADLNKLTYFKKRNPSSENIAKYIYDRLASRLSAKRSEASPKGTTYDLRLTTVSVWETENSRATYRGE